MNKMAFLVLLLLPFNALADRAYTNGNYWTVTSVDTHAGMYDEYMADLNVVWRKSLDMLKKDGKVLSYRVFNNVHPRDSEPNLFLMVEWKSAGDVLDASDEYWDAQEKKLFGSVDNGTKANVKRGEMRTIMSQTFLREQSFK
jgi:hypothetical protein